MSGIVGHHAWCQVQDHAGPCPSEEILLPNGGSTWIEATPTPTIIVSLGRRAKDEFPELTSAQARVVAGVLTDLAVRVDKAGHVSRRSP
jgi:hypothetical protein